MWVVTNRAAHQGEVGERERGHQVVGAAVSRLIRASLDPVTVADFIGHEDPHTTLRVYASLWDRQKTDEAIRLALAGIPTAARISETR